MKNRNIQCGHSTIFTGLVREIILLAGALNEEHTIIDNRLSLQEDNCPVQLLPNKAAFTLNYHFVRVGQESDLIITLTINSSVMVITDY